MSRTRSHSPRYKLKNILSLVAVLLLLILLTFTQAYIGKLKGSLILFHALANLNFILLLLVGIMTIRYLIRLYFERPGSRFRQKLVIAFMISTLVPSFFLFLISTTFIRDTLNKWLNPIPGEPLEEAMSIVRLLHDFHQERGWWLGSQLAKAIHDQKLLDPARKLKLESFIQQKQLEYNLGMIQVFNDQGVEVTRVINENIPVGSVVTTHSKNIETTLSGEVVPTIPVTAGGGTLYRSFVPISEGENSIQGVVVANFFSTERLKPKMDRIQLASETYKQQLILRQPIKREYMYLFLIPTVLILFFAIWFGFYLAKGVTLPIQRLAEGARSITAGKLDFDLDIRAYDEIGILVDSFEKMRQELHKNKTVMDTQHAELQTVNKELDRKQHYMATLLDSFTTGVVALDRKGSVTTVNPAAQTMLQVEPQFMIGRAYHEAFADESLQQLKIMIEKGFTSRVSLLNKEIHFFSKRMTLHLSVSTIVMKEPEGEFQGLALVCEDLTELIKVQKVAAWSEVARRIAHEIKNPLTPIRLSAQRIKRKMNQDKTGNVLLEDCCATIVREVDTIQRLVDSFSRFAKMPEAKPVPTNIHLFVNKVLDGFTHLHPKIEVVTKFSPEVPLVNIDENLLKQAVTNIIDNSVEAMGNEGILELKTSIDRFLNIVRLEICDNGPGIRSEDKDKLFMPYFSTKKLGTGLGLAIVARIIAEHYGYVRVADNQPQGTRLIIELPVIIPGLTKNENTTDDKEMLHI